MRGLIGRLSMVFFLFYSGCMIEGSDDFSLILSQIEEINLVIGDTLIFQKNANGTLDYKVSYLDKNGDEIDFGSAIKPKLYLDEELVNDFTLDLNRVAEYEIYLALKTLSTIQSNKIKVRVVNPLDFIKSFTLSLSDSTNNVYALSGKSSYDFNYSIKDEDGLELDIEPSLFVAGIETQKFKDVVINEPGSIPVYAEIFGLKSNVISIQSREDITYPTVRIPVIFHILPNSNSVTLNRLSAKIIDLNKAFDNSYLLGDSDPKHQSAVSSNIEFYLAETDPMDNQLQEIGINRLSNGASLIVYPPNNDEVRFLFDNMWDPTNYLNLFITDIQGAGGFAYYPVLEDFQLDGMLTVPTGIQLNYPYVGVVGKESINIPNNVYTLAHEVGHMLGLPHSFNTTNIDCTNFDFCLDTEEHGLSSIPNSMLSIDCEGKLVLPTDFMDYKGFSNSFTFDQRERMRRVLDYNPFLPTARNGARLGPFVKGRIDFSVKPVE